MDEPTPLRTNASQRVDPRTGDPVVQLAFFTMSKDHSYLKQKWTQFTAWLTGQYIDGNRFYDHVELRFSEGQVTSVNYVHGKVYMADEKLLDRRGYSCFYELTLSKKDHQTLKKKALEFKDRPFNLAGMMCNFLPGLNRCFAQDYGGDQVFCSEYIVLLFQSIGYFTELEAHKTSPNDLFRAIVDDPAWTKSYNHVYSDLVFPGRRGKSLRADF